MTAWTELTAPMTFGTYLMAMGVSMLLGAVVTWGMMAMGRTYAKEDAYRQGHKDGWAERDALKLPPDPALTRAAATATRATIEDGLSLLEPLGCGRSSPHVRLADVRRVVRGTE